MMYKYKVAVKIMIKSVKSTKQCNTNINEKHR